MNCSDVARLKQLASFMQRPSRELLMEHVDGEAWAEVGVVLKNSGRRNAMMTLMDRGLIRYSGHKHMRRQTTTITEDGRFVLAIILADFAEALIKAGYALETVGTPVVARTARLMAERWGTDSAGGPSGVLADTAP